MRKWKNALIQKQNICHIIQSSIVGALGAFAPMVFGELLYTSKSASSRKIELTQK